MREFAKQLVLGVAFLLVAPLVATFRMRRGLQAFQGAAQLLAGVPGLAGRYLRAAYYRATLTSCSHRFVIEYGSYFSHWDVELGDNVYIGAYCIVARCAIGDNTMLASGVQVLDGGRQHGTDLAGPTFQDQAHESVRITIGPDCWIGSHAVVMAGLGPKTIVGAGAVVTKSSQGNEVVVGIPARARTVAPRESQ